ncbi:MAG: NAD(P)-dependent oxidoreductase [Candidatus Pacebacteria bacterium]|nr:NAD(P)-dependent oxidoreductase [Candidatus Paceibacterota bacterium]
MKNKKILITGGNGMVGSQAKFGIKLSRKQFDITNISSIEKAVKKYKPNVILHLGAMTNMLGCEEDPKQAYKINVKGTENLARICKENNIKLVYLSTCAVFDGRKKTPYNEKDKPKPLNVYGKTKLQGEIVSQLILPNVLIIRTGWLFGGGKKDTKFVKKVFYNLKIGKEVKAVSDRNGSPTYIPDLLYTVKKLIDKDSIGIFHIVNNGTASYFDIAKEVKKLGKFKSSILSVKAQDLESSLLKRGKMEGLKSFTIKLRSWKSALQEYLINLK